MHDNSTQFQWEYIELNNAGATASNITNSISKLFLEYFKFLKGDKSLQSSSKNNDSLLASYDYVAPK